MSGSAEERDDLGELRALWQTQPTSVSVDIEQLQRGLRRRQWLTRLMMWGDWTAVLAVVVLVGWVLLRSPTPEPRMFVWMGFLSVLGVVSVVASMRARRPVWSVADEVDTDAVSLIEASIRQAEASLAIVRIVYWTVGACFAFMAAWAVSEFLAGELLAPEGLRRRLSAYAFALVYGGAFLVGGALIARRRRSEIARWRELRGALGGEA